MKTIFYRCVPHNPDALVFAEAQDARRVDRIWHALNAAKTWGQFKRLLPTSEHEQFEDYEAADDEVFDALDYTAEGDYPGFKRKWRRSSQPTSSPVLASAWIRH
jgi:hypothetical protein